jgi:hypothetical protein
LVGLLVFPNATSTPPAPASVAQVVVKVAAVPLVFAAPALIVKLPQVGAVVSKIIVSVVSVLVFPKLSLNLIYTVFVPSPAVNVCARVALHVVQLVGLLVFPNATSTPPTPASVAHVVVSVTVVIFVFAAPVLIVKVPETGAALSCVLLVLVLHALIFNAPSLLLTK